ncbi:MAG TPA: Hpt domain-containing protein [Rhizomicrobium sp.]|jgi:chemotaxis protein histidine kinase CheA
MIKQKPIEIFTPPNILKAKVGGSGFGLDSAALRRAEAAMENLKSEFAEWMNTDIEKLAESRDAYAGGPNANTKGQLFRASHDLKGQALTFEHPVVARMAASLCKLLDGTPNTPLLLVDAHVNAIKILVRQNVRDVSDPTTNAVAAELEQQVRELRAA